MKACERLVRGRNAVGTDAGHQRHWRAKEEPCEACVIAHRNHVKKIQKSHPDPHLKANQKWRSVNPGYFAKRQKERLKTDISFRLARILRKRLWSGLQGNLKPAQTFELLGCSLDFVRQHLEKQFSEGMSWDNYGLWEVDHIRPIVSFDMTSETQVRECFHWSNLQPLWALDNRIKGTKDCFVRAALIPAVPSPPPATPPTPKTRTTRFP